LVAALAMAPELAIGLTVSDSYRFYILWPDQFGDVFRSGHWYPRWLPLSWGGLGSPNFYFYPPLFFWVTSAFDTITAGALPPERFVPFGSLTLLALSGVTMRSWLSVEVRQDRAFLGGIAYMLAPYHLYDIYARGALAEASAYAFVPVVMLALARIGEGRARYLPLLSVGYAALLLTHLPTALLVTVFLIPPYAALVAARSPRPGQFLCGAIGAGVVGIALAAIYLVPALTLLPYVSPGALSGSFYRPENWFFWHLQPGPMAARMLLIVPVTLAASLFAIGTIRSARARAHNRLPWFWSIMTLVLAIVIAGLIPPVWGLPGLRLVQFPWRALLLVEFTGITMLAIQPPNPRSPAAVGGSLLAAFAYCVLLLMSGHTIERTWSGQKQTAAQIRSRYLDAPEYLPAGTKIVQGQGPDDVTFELPNLPVASATTKDATIKASNAVDGAMVLTVESPVATTVSLHRFYFPHWRLHDASGQTFPIKPDPRQKVVTFRAPAGRSAFRLDLGMAPHGVIARIVSLAGALALALMLGFTRLSARLQRRTGQSISA
jgi:hypothetical protein